MEEVDGILIYTLKQIGCDVSSKVSELSPVQLIQCVSKCLRLRSPESEIPDFDTNVSMSARYKVASQVAQAVTDIGYQDEIGCQSFLYPTEAETRKLLIFMVENLPRDNEIGDQIETLLSKIAQEKIKEDEFSNEQNSIKNGVEVDGIRLPIAVDVDSLPKETLKFYASHLADLTFAKHRAKYRNKPEEKPIVPVVLDKNIEKDSDDDFGDPDEPISEPIKKEVIQQKPQIKEKPKPIEKPKTKPAIPDKPKIDNKKDTEDAEAAAKQALADEAEAAARIKALQEDTKVKAKLVKEKEKQLHESSYKTVQLQEEISRLKKEMDEKSKILDRLKKTDQLLSGDENALEKVKNAVNSQVDKLMNLSNQWEKHRKPLVDEIRSKKSSNEMTEAARTREEIRNLKSKMKEMGQEAKSKEESYNQLLVEYEKLPKDLSRSSYTRRIGEIIGNIKKQKKEITKVLSDTKDIQKDINTLSGRLDRTFAVADELIYKDAEKDKNVAQSYKLLVAIHSDFSRVIKTLEEIGNSKRHQRDYEDKLELERGKNIDDKLKRLKADMSQMQHENRILEAKLRDPTKKS